MIGRVDDKSRALLTIQVSNELDGTYLPATTWIDTAFDGHLVFSLQLIRDLELDELVETEAILADGSRVTLETFVCFVDWFGTRIPLQVIANDGKYPLLGTGLLEQHVLQVDYINRNLRLD